MGGSNLLISSRPYEVKPAMTALGTPPATDTQFNVPTKYRYSSNNYNVILSKGVRMKRFDYFYRPDTRRFGRKTRFRCNTLVEININIPMEVTVKMLNAVIR